MEIETIVLFIVLVGGIIVAVSTSADYTKMLKDKKDLCEANKGIMYESDKCCFIVDNTTTCSEMIYINNTALFLED